MLVHRPAFDSILHHKGIYRDAVSNKKASFSEFSWLFSPLFAIHELHRNAASIGLPSMPAYLDRLMAILFR